MSRAFEKGINEMFDREKFKDIIEKKIECHGLIEKMITECQNFGEK